MIVGLGIDFVDLARVRRVVERHGERFFERILTEREQAYCRRFRDPVPHAAARFAAKEAVLKALGTGLAKGIRWLDVEVVRDEEGAPSVELAGRAAEIARARSAERVQLSISHDHGAAIAIAILERGR